MVFDRQRLGQFLSEGIEKLVLTIVFYDQFCDVIKSDSYLHRFVLYPIKFKNSSSVKTVMVGIFFALLSLLPASSPTTK